MLKEIPQEYIKEFEPSNKLALLSTIDDYGYPHITLIISLQARNANEMIWGQFIEGLSKKHVKNNPKTGFLIMNLKKELWRGRATWTHAMKEGPEYIMFNEKPLYRYNSYTGIHTVHYMDLVDITEKQKLNIISLAYGYLLTKIAKSKVSNEGLERILNGISEGIFNKADSLKFLSYIDNEGYPIIVPVIQCQTSGSSRAVFAAVFYSDEINKIQQNSKAAIFAMTLEMEDVLIKGTYRGIIKSNGIKTGVIDIEKVYNSMPPVMGYIYPKRELTSITKF